jgi:hypothetical protein
MPTVSRSATEFLRRHGVIPTPKTPRPLLDLTQMKVRSIPLQQDQLDPSLMTDAAGSPPPDRGPLGPWPPPREIV